MENLKAAFYTALFPELIFFKSRCGVYLGGFFFLLLFGQDGFVFVF